MDSGVSKESISMLKFHSALLDAGIQMKCLPSAGTACLTEENEKISLTQGPSWSEQSGAIATIQAVFNKR